MMPTIRVVLILLAVALIARDTQAASRLVETPHYRIHSDLDSELTDDLARRMEAMYDQYTRRFAGFAERTEHHRMEVYLFRTRADYIRFTEDRFPNTGGVFIPRRKLLAVFLEGQGRDGIRRTLQHEAFHQFAHEAIGPQLPIWLNEGLAQVFEEGLWTGSSFVIGQVPPRRVRQLEQDMRDRRLTPFRTFLGMSDEEWAKNLRDRAVGATQYNQSWAMAHFLIYAIDDTGEPRYRPRLLEMLRLIRGGVPAERAFASAFSDNIDGFQQRFVEYARKIEPTPEATWIENQIVLADMLTSLAGENVTFDDIKSFRETVLKHGYQLQYSRGPLQWSTAEDPRTYFTDPQGREMQGDRLFFLHRRGAPLPDLVCRPFKGHQFHTRFYKSGQRIEYEVLIENWR